MRNEDVDQIIEAYSYYLKAKNQELDWLELEWDDLGKSDEDKLYEDISKIIGEKIPIGERNILFEKVNRGITKENCKYILEKDKSNKKDSILIFSDSLIIQEFNEIKGNTELLVNMWKHMSQKVQDESFDKVFELIKGNLELVFDFFKNTSREVQDKNFVQIFEAVKKDSELVIDIFCNASPEVRDKNFNTVYEAVKEKTDLVQKIWYSVSPEVQDKNFEKILEVCKERNYILSDIWPRASQKVQKENFQKVFEVLKEEKNTDLILEIWRSSEVEIKEENFGTVLEVFNKNPEVAVDIWIATPHKMRDENFKNVLELIKEDSETVESMWKLVSQKARIAKFFDAANVLKGGNLQSYKKFINNYLGDVEYDKDNNPIIPEALKVAMKSFSANESYEENENYEKVRRFEANLKSIIKNWDLIERNIQYKKANSILNDGLEIRCSVEEILKSYDVALRIKPDSPAALEFEMTEGSEKVGLDTQFTESTTTAVQRAHMLAKKIDEAGTTKKFPDFSCKDNQTGVELRVLHPQDKSAILLGYETNCCFRPNGNADNAAESEYSLLQYCTTTPYGGVLECGKVNDNNKFDVYMGTPFLVNGNCMMFHSYETKNSSECENVNVILKEAAKQAIEKSNGSIGAVMMTTLYTGAGRLDISDKFDVGRTFYPYWGNEEYKGYKECRNR